MVASVSRPTGIVKNGLILNLDASNSSSYSGTGTTWTDLTGRANGTIVGAVTWVGNGNQSYFKWTTVGSGNYVSSSVTQKYLHFTIVFYPDFTLNNSANLVGLLGVSNDSTSADTSLRFGGANGTGPWTVNNPDNTDGYASTAISYYVNNQVYTGSGNILSGWNILSAYRSNQTKFAWGDSGSGFAYYLGTEGYSTVRDFQGRIALVLGYNRQLTAAESLQNYTALRTRFGV